MANLLTPAEAGQRIGCGRGHVYNLIAAGHLDRYDISLVSHRTKTRVLDTDVDAYIERMRKPTARTSA